MNKSCKIFIIFFIVFWGCEKKEHKPAGINPYLIDRVECMNMPRPEGSYNYPVLPGSDKWKSFESLEEKEKACQVPVKVLRKQSTQAVIQALWEYPMVINFMAWNSKQDGFEFVFYPLLNAYQELVRRADAGRALLERYLLVEPIDAYVPANYVLEIFPAQPEFLAQLTLEEKKKAVRRGLEICEIRLNDPGYADLYAALCTVYFLGRVMRSASYAPFSEILVSNPDWKVFFDKYFTTPEKLIELEEQVFILSANFSGYQNINMPLT